MTSGLCQGSLDAERVLDLAEETAAITVLEVRGGKGLSQLAQQFPLLGRNLGRDHHPHGDDLIAARTASDVGHSLSPQAKLLPRLGPRWDLQLHRAVDGRHLDLGPERSLCHVERQIQVDLLPLPNEVGVRLDADAHIQVARRPVRHVLALAGQAQRRVTVDPRRDRDRDRARLGHPASSATGGARIGDYSPLAPAVVARHRRDELTKDGVLHPADLAAAAADRADRRLLAPAHTRAAAIVAQLEARDLDLFLGPEDRLFEGQLNRGLEVGPAHRPAAPAPATAEERLEDVAEGRAAEAEGVASRAEPARDARVAEAVVGSAALLVPQDLVRFVDLLEAFLCAFFSVDVGVVLTSKPPVGTPDLLRRRVPA